MYKFSKTKVIRRDEIKKFQTKGEHADLDLLTESDPAALFVRARLHEPTEEGLKKKNELRPVLGPAGVGPVRPETQSGSQPCWSRAPHLLPVAARRGCCLFVCVWSLMETTPD